MTDSTVTEVDAPVCISCGDRPWGWGYCGEYCKVCAHTVRYSKRLSSWYIADLTGECVSSLYDTEAEAAEALAGGEF